MDNFNRFDDSWLSDFYACATAIYWIMMIVALGFGHNLIDSL